MKRLTILSIVLSCLLLATPAAQAADDPLLLDGTDAAVLDAITISDVPARVQLTGSVTLTLNDGSQKVVVNPSGFDGFMADITKPITCQPIITGSGTWSVSIAPLGITDQLSAAGSGSYISDFLDITEPRTATLTVDTNAQESTYYVTQVYLRYAFSDGRWQGDLLVNQNTSARDDVLTVSFPLLPHDGGCYYAVNADPGTTWSITVS